MSSISIYESVHHITIMMLPTTIYSPENSVQFEHKLFSLTLIHFSEQ